MTVLVPLPFDISNMAHGRNLRIVHLLRRIANECDLLCVGASEDIVAGAKSVLGDVPVICADSSGDESVSTDDLLGGSSCLRRALGYFGYDRRLMSAVSKRARQADVVLGFDLASAVYLMSAANASKTSAGAHGRRLRTVCDLIDDPWLTWQSLPAIERFCPTGIKTAVSVNIIRRELLGTFDALIAVAPRDAESLSRVTGLDVSVVPNGVEVSAMVDAGSRGEPLAVFTGAMNFAPNESAACYLGRHVWPRVLSELSGADARSARLAIVGADPTPRVQRLSAIDGIRVTGRVDDLGEWLRRARVAVAPMISGCGMKNKVLEACAAGCPVVTTSLGAAGLPAGLEHGIIVADDPKQFAKATAAMLADESAAQKVGDAARRAALEQFCWSASAGKLMTVLARFNLASPAASGCVETDDEKLFAPDYMPLEGRNSDEEALIHADS